MAGEGLLLTLALARTDGGMTFSGANACRGSTKEDRILPHFLHSAAKGVSVNSDALAGGAPT